MTPVVVRASSTPEWVDCQRRWAVSMMRPRLEELGYEFADGLRHVAPAVGVAVHAAVARFIETRSPVGLGDVAIATYEAEGVAAFDDVTPNRDAAHRQIHRMIAAYVANVAPNIGATKVEQRLETQVSKRVVLSGQSDVLAVEARWLRDLKTGKRRRYSLPQFGAYVIIAKAHGHTVATVAEDYVARTPLCAPQPKPETHFHDVTGAENAARGILKQIDATLESFEATQLPWDFVANPNSFLCDTKWCPAFGRPGWCHEWRLRAPRGNGGGNGRPKPIRLGVRSEPRLVEVVGDRPQALGKVGALARK